MLFISRFLDQKIRILHFLPFLIFFRHLSAKNFQHMGKTLQVLLNQVQQYVYDYNMGRFTNSDQLSDSFNNYEWNFPGLRKNVAGATNLEDQIIDQDGMKELVLLQQRVVLQVYTIYIITHLKISGFLLNKNVC